VKRYSVHELSIALNLVEIVEEAARRAGAECVVAVHLRLGAMSGVVREALEFCFPLASDTLCWPYGLWLHHGRLAIADSGNNRVMIHDLAAILARLETA